MSTSTQSDGTFASEITDSSSVESRKSGATDVQDAKNGDGMARQQDESESKVELERVASEAKVRSCSRLVQV